MRRIGLLVLCCILTGSVLATDWNVDSGDWDVDANWTEGKPDGTNGYINLTRTDAVCNLDTDEGLISARWMQQNGNILNILAGGRFGAQWARVGRNSAAYVNMSGDGTYVMNDDDLYIGLESGYCEWVMSGTGSLVTQGDDGDDGEEVYVGEDGGTALFKLIGSGVTVDVDRIHLTANSAGGTATLEYVMDAGGASTIVAQRTYIGESGDAYLVLSATADLPGEDIVLMEATSGYDVEGPGFTAINGVPATEGAIVFVGGNIYALSYVYDANGDSENNDVALVFVQSARFLATNPNPANGSVQSVSPTTLSWTNPDPNDGVSDITCTVYFGMEPADPNRTGMDRVTLPANVSTIDINATNFPTYGAQPIEDVNDFYWVVDCVDASLSNPDLGKAPVSWTFSTYYNQVPVVDAGPDQVLYGDGVNYPTVNLAGSASDDGQPDPPATLTVEWTVADGPESAVINSPDATSTTVTLTESGVYEFELTADDGLAQTSDSLLVVVGIDSCEASFLNGEDYNEMDFDTDCDVDLADFANFAAEWLACSNTLEGC